MTFVLLADINYDINGGEYSLFVEDILLSIVETDSSESATQEAKDILWDLSKNDSSILVSDSEINVISLEDYMSR